MDDEIIDIHAPLKESIAKLQSLYVGKVYTFRPRTQEEREYTVTQKDVDRAGRTVKGLQAQIDEVCVPLGLLH
jgi:hypothetical protein